MLFYTVFVSKFMDTGDWTTLGTQLSPPEYITQSATRPLLHQGIHREERYRRHDMATSLLTILKSEGAQLSEIRINLG